MLQPVLQIHMFIAGAAITLPMFHLLLSGTPLAMPASPFLPWRYRSTGLGRKGARAGAGAGEGVGEGVGAGVDNY